MDSQHTYPFQRSAVGELSASTSQDRGTESHPYGGNEPFLGKLRPPTKATRRIRGEIACAECRRLKIRCDRVVPCSTCVKRGCTALCPNGTIPPGDGSRFVEAATDHLREKMTKLEARMRSLEDALSIIHAPYSDKPHPLLVRNSDEDLFDDADDSQQDGQRDSPGLGAPQGTLLVDSQGGSRFFGPSGSSESLLMSQEVNLPSSSTLSGLVVRELDPSYLPPAINQCYESFPFTPPNLEVEAVRTSISSHLPTIERAISLCGIFTENLAWMFDIVSRRELVENLIPVIYNQASGEYGPHEVSLLFLVFALGALVDLGLPPYDVEAQHYYRLARASLALQPVLVEQSVTTVKVLHLMSVYNSMSGKEGNLEQSYALLDFASQVAMQIGLHVDPASWGIQRPEAYARRVYFWNLMSGVLWQSLVTGRPPSLLTSYIDCQIPTSEDENAFREGEFSDGSGVWKYRADSECLVPLAQAVLAAKPANYEAILDLTEKIGGLSFPCEDTPLVNASRAATSLRGYVRSQYRELMLIFLHRAYFAQAMSEHVVDPISSPYGHSVKVAYSSACVILQATRSQFLKTPTLCPRLWKMWSFAFSAAVIVGVVAVRGAHLGFEPPPLKELEATCKAFQTVSENNRRAAQAVPVLQGLLQKAYSAHQPGATAPQCELEELTFLTGRSHTFYPSPSTLIGISSPSTPSTQSEDQGSNTCPDPPQSTNLFDRSAQPPFLLEPQRQAPYPPVTTLDSGQPLYPLWTSHSTEGWTPAPESKPYSMISRATTPQIGPVPLYQSNMPDGSQHHIPRAQYPAHQHPSYPAPAPSLYHPSQQYQHQHQNPNYAGAAIADLRRAGSGPWDSMFPNYEPLPGSRGVSR